MTPRSFLLWSTLPGMVLGEILAQNIGFLAAFALTIIVLFVAYIAVERYYERNFSSFFSSYKRLSSASATVLILLKILLNILNMMEKLTVKIINYAAQPALLIMLFL